MATVKDFLCRQATPFTTGLFVVSAVSGVALFVHLGTATFREMHEILSMVLLVPVALHVWRNWRSLVGYFKRGPMWVATAVSLVLAVGFAVAAGNGGGNPMMQMVGRLQSAPLTAVAPAIGSDEQAVLDALVAAGISPVKPSDSIADLSARTGRDAFEIVAALNAAAKVAPAGPATTPAP